MRLVCILFTFENSTEHTDGPTDGRTDTTSYRAATVHLIMVRLLSYFNTLILLMQVFNRLIRQYKYLERTLEDATKKVLMNTQRFQPEQRAKLADVTVIFLEQVRSGRSGLLLGDGCTMGQNQVILRHQ